jgi:glycosyltransferase involved in cell wall biosynthesis
MKILLLESFYGGSHKVWTDNLSKIYGDQLRILTLPDRFWKWRMEASGIEFAKRYLELNESFDIILFSDLMNINQFVSLSKLDRDNTKLYLYMHENQICYPWQADRSKINVNRDRHFGFMNIVNCLAVDHIIFNSEFHRQIFFKTVPEFLSPFPDFIPKIDLDKWKAHSTILPIPLELSAHISNSSLKKPNQLPVILWNHRWEHDKNPDLFFKTLITLSQEGLKFELIVIGESYKSKPPIFDVLNVELKPHVKHVGFVESRDQYISLLKNSDILPVTSNHEFFGISVVEAISSGVIPLLPKRLSYPEHLDPDKYPEVFYESDSEYYLKLKALIKSWPRSTVQYSETMMKYDLSEVANQYEEIFS